MKRWADRFITVRASLYGDSSVETENPPQEFQEVGNRVAPTGFQHISLPSLKGSVSRLLRILYSDSSLNTTPVSYLKEEKTDRNQSMLDRHKHGDTLAEIAHDYGISVARVHQIISKLAD